VRKLNSPELKKLVQDFSAEAITVVKNEDEILPFKNLEDQPMQLIAVGAPR
jgi:beta-glucosidase-like glycosyl hydrolase